MITKNKFFSPISDKNLIEMDILIEMFSSKCPNCKIIHNFGFFEQKYFCHGCGFKVKLEPLRFVSVLVNKINTKLSLLSNIKRQNDIIKGQLLAYREMKKILLSNNNLQVKIFEVIK